MVVVWVMVGAIRPTRITTAATTAIGGRMVVMMTVTVVGLVWCSVGVTIQITQCIVCGIHTWGSKRKNHSFLLITL